MNSFRRAFRNKAVLLLPMRELPILNLLLSLPKPLVLYTDLIIGLLGDQAIMKWPLTDTLSGR